jgi:hypothetical protein
VISEVAQALAIICLAGHVGGRWHYSTGKIATAQHEASHAVGAWIFGLHVGEVSIERLNDSLGHVQISLDPITEGVTPENCKRGDGDTMSDVRRAARVVSREAPGWRQILRELRTVRTQTAAMIASHWDVIDAFAGKLLDCGQIKVGEAIPLLESLEANLNAEAIAGLDTGEIEIVRSTNITTLARVSTASVRLADDQGASGDQRAYWSRIGNAANEEAARRNVPAAYVERVGTNQAAAVERFITIQSRREIARAA